jgi:hypothetical protein
MQMGKLTLWRFQPFKKKFRHCCLEKKNCLAEWPMQSLVWRGGLGAKAFTKTLELARWPLEIFLSWRCGLGAVAFENKFDLAL